MEGKMTMTDLRLSLARRRGGSHSGEAAELLGALGALLAGPYRAPAPGHTREVVALLQEGAHGAPACPWQPREEAGSSAGWAGRVGPRRRAQRQAIAVRLHGGPSASAKRAKKEFGVRFTITLTLRERWRVVDD